MRFLVSFFLIAGITWSCSSNNTSGSEPETGVIKADTVPPPGISTVWSGKWERREWQNEASLEIQNVQGDSIVFSLFASNGGHTGEIEGKAVVTGNIAIFLNEDESDTCLLQFQLVGDSIIAIDQKKGFCFAGMSVTYDGDYKNSKKLRETEHAENLVSLGVFDTKKEDSVFKALVGDEYSLFVNSTQLLSEDDDLDGFGATVRSSGVRGLFTAMENIIMIDSSYNIWAAVIDDNKVYYFTNKKKYKKRLPKTIDNWRQPFGDYPIIYK